MSIGLRGAVLVLGLALATTTGFAAPLLDEPSVPSAKALGAAMLGVDRAGARLVAVGERGTVLVSDNHGASWRQVSSPVRVSLTAVHFVDARTGWAVGHQGVILHTRDGGEHWVKQLDGVSAAQRILASAPAGDERAQRLARRFVADGPDKPFFDVAFADALRGIAVGAYNLAFTTADGGGTWTPLDLDGVNPKARHLYAARIVQDQVYLAGEQGLLLKASLADWRFAALASPYKGSFFGLLSTRSGGLIAHGLRGHAFRSMDGGLQWEPLQTGATATITAGAQAADGTVVMLSQTGDLQFSDADAQHFTRAPAHQPLPAAGLVATADGAWVIATLRGMQRVARP